ncbi:importin subunit alpha-1-like isoform X3 [Nicotiana tomentosiformis]|uniref:importin subunit alpha-1-like isoform X3 n=1 Tax=Nicotiana tomentosiformis TaxID=4098 RepID=UPI00051ADEC1
MSMLTSGAEEGLPVNFVGFQQKLSSIVEGLESQEEEKKMWAIQKLRILFNDDVTFLVHALESGIVVPLLDEILRGEDSFVLKLEAANAVMDSIPDMREVIDLVIDRNLVVILLNLLRFPAENVCEQAMEKLGIVALSPVGRGYVLMCMALDNLLHILTCCNILLLRKATQTISVLSRGTPKVPFVKVKPAIQSLCFLVASNDDREVLRNACWALYYLSGGIDVNLRAYCNSKSSISHSVVSQSDIIRDVFEAYFFPVLLKLLDICRGDDSQKEELMKARSIYGRDVLHCLSDLLDRRKEERLVCLCIAYITLGRSQRAKAVVDAAGLIDRLRQLAKARQMDVAAAAISNAIISISDESYINELVDCCIGPLCHYLNVFGNKIICTISLKGVENMYGEKHKGPDCTNIYAKRIEEAGGLKNLNGMCCSLTMGLQAYEILSKYWPANATSCKCVLTYDTIPPLKTYFRRRRERGSKICAALTKSNFPPA